MFSPSLLRCTVIDWPLSELSGTPRNFPDLVRSMREKKEQIPECQKEKLGDRRVPGESKVIEIDGGETHSVDEAKATDVLSCDHGLITLVSCPKVVGGIAAEPPVLGHVLINEA
jgi:hypothetical protein